MSTTTTNYSLVKPELTDAADITAMNENWDTLDQVIKENKDEAKNYTDNKFASIPTPDVSGQINSHNTNTSAHNDIRQLVSTAQSDVTNHIGNKQNPHGVTKSQVGLGNVDNTADSAKPVSTAQATAIADAKSAGTTAQSNLNTHTSNKSNPHGVTAAQAGAVAKTGDTMTGSLEIQHDNGVYTQRTIGTGANAVTYRNQLAVSGRAGKAVIQTWKSGSNYGALYIGNDELQLGTGSGAVYNIFGEHNTSALGTAVQNLLKGGTVSMVKSIQRGVISLNTSTGSSTATINAVNTGKAMVLYTGADIQGSADPVAIQLTLDSSTVVKAYRTKAGNVSVTIPYQVVEFY